MKTIKLFVMLLLFSTSGVLAQEKPVIANNTAESEDPINYSDVKIKPEFRGEPWAFYISHNLRYPEEALKKKIAGKVYVSFIIEKNGEISNVNVVEGLGNGLDQEAVRVIKNSPKWKPGYQVKKVPVRVLYVMPIAFNPNN